MTSPSTLHLVFQIYKAKEENVFICLNMVKKEQVYHVFLFFPSNFKNQTELFEKSYYDP